MKATRTNMHEAVRKMLDALGLRCKVRKFPRIIENVTNEHRKVRQFVDSRGYLLEWRNDIPTRNSIGGGLWNVFKDDDEATFKLFTKWMKNFGLVDFSYSKNPSTDYKLVANPFYGCRSIEEVFVKCDLLGV